MAQFAELTQQNVVQTYDMWDAYGQGQLEYKGRTLDQISDVELIEIKDTLELTKDSIPTDRTWFFIITNELTQRNTVY
jgi:hypothetical protein